MCIPQPGALRDVHDLPALGDYLDSELKVLAISLAINQFTILYRAKSDFLRQFCPHESGNSGLSRMLWVEDLSEMRERVTVEADRVVPRVEVIGSGLQGTLDQSVDVVLLHLVVGIQEGDPFCVDLLEPTVTYNGCTLAVLVHLDDYAGHWVALHEHRP